MLQDIIESLFVNILKSMVHVLRLTDEYTAIGRCRRSPKRCEIDLLPFDRKQLLGPPHRQEQRQNHVGYDFMFIRPLRFFALRAVPHEQTPLARNCLKHIVNRVVSQFASFSSLSVSVGLGRQQWCPSSMSTRIGRFCDPWRGSFEDAKANWLDRLRSDDDAIRSVDRLEKSLQQYKGSSPANRGSRGGFHLGI